MFFNLVVLLTFLQCSVSSIDVTDEPPIYGSEHKSQFFQAMKNMDEIVSQMINPTVVMDNQYTEVCDQGKTTFEKFRIGFDSKYPDQ
jgi:hypothetical protein